MDAQLPRQDIKDKHLSGIRGRADRRIALDSLIIGAGIIFFALSSPRGTPSLVLLAGFLAIAASVTALLDILLCATGLEKAIGRRYRRMLYLSVAVLPAFLLLLQSLGQLSVRYAAVLLLLVGTGSFYIGRQGRRPVG